MVKKQGGVIYAKAQEALKELRGCSDDSKRQDLYLVARNAYNLAGKTFQEEKNYKRAQIAYNQAFDLSEEFEPTNDSWLQGMRKLARKNINEGFPKKRMQRIGDYFVYRHERKMDAYYQKHPEEVDVRTLPGRVNKTTKDLRSRIYSLIVFSGVFAGVVFLSSKVTGNVIGMSAQTSSLIGLGLLAVGLVSGFFWLKSKRK